MPVRTGTRGRAPMAQYVPVGYLVVATALAALLLPTVLRPPQDQQSTTAAFSPDAPPDDAPPEVVLQSLRSASSATAGGVPEEQIIEEEIVTVEAEAPPPGRASRGRCFGDPPRQTESLYSHLCVPAWTGADNGGATAPGVFEDEVRVTLAVGLSSEVPEGRLDREFHASDVDDTRHLKVWQTYFNERFEFYGRYLQFYIIRQSATNADQQRSTVQTAKDQYETFAMLGNASNAVNEAIRLGIVDFGSVNNPVPFYNDGFPYAYSFTMDSWQTRYMASEVACKHYVGRPPGDLNERQDISFNYDEPRKWGVIAYQDNTRTGAVDMYTDLIERCGGEVTLSQEYNLTDNAQSIGGTMGKMKAAGVTTLLLGVDGITPSLLTSEAQRIQYFPEYIHAGTGGTDSNSTGRLLEPNQARHMVGLSPNEIPRADEDKDWYRAYKEIDPNGDPDASFFRSLQQVAGGVQHAGPDLNPLTFWHGLSSQPYRAPEPDWSIGGGYRESFDFVAQKDLTYEDYMSLIWFDPEGDDPDSSRSGAWCHVFNGKRFKVGEIPTDPIPWWDNSQCIHSPPKGTQG